MEEIKIAAAESRDMKSGITGEIVNSEADSFTPKFSTVEEIVASECKRPKTLYSNSQAAGENPLDSVSIESPLVKESDGMMVTTGGELCPLTPSPDGEIVEMLSVSDQIDDLEALSDCETPTECLFNPFAPAPEKFALAPAPPAPKKMMPREEYTLPICWPLNFDSDSDSEEKVESTVSDEEGCILESVCKSFIELIVSNQLKEICSEDLAEEDNSSDDTSDGFKTPTSIPLLTGIAETCPDAPKVKRPSIKSRKLDQTICRKLEFESIWI